MGRIGRRNFSLTVAGVRLSVDTGERLWRSPLLELPASLRMVHSLHPTHATHPAHTTARHPGLLLLVWDFADQRLGGEQQ